MGQRKRIAALILAYMIFTTMPIYANTVEAEAIYEASMKAQITNVVNEKIEKGTDKEVNYYQQYKELKDTEEKKVRFFDLSYGEAEKIPVLMYHHLLKEEEYYYDNNPAAITVEAFEEQMAYLHKYGFNTITLLELEKFLKGELEVPKRSVVITFDDGYSSNYQYAYPILKKYGFEASIFLITHSVKAVSEAFTPVRSTSLGWDQIVETMDIFEYANHSHDMHRENEDGINYLNFMPYDTIKQDLALNKAITQSDYFAYPYGKYNEMTLEILEELGYQLAFTTRTGYVRRGDSLLELNRFGIYPTTSMMRFREIIHGVG